MGNTDSKSQNINNNKHQRRPTNHPPLHKRNKNIRRNQSNKRKQIRQNKPNIRNNRTNNIRHNKDYCNEIKKNHKQTYNNVTYEESMNTNYSPMDRNLQISGLSNEYQDNRIIDRSRDRI